MARPVMTNDRGKSALELLRRTGPFVQAARTVTKERCDNPRCRCAQEGPLHEVALLTRKEDKRARTVYVPRELREQGERWVQEGKLLKRLVAEVSQARRDVADPRDPHKIVYPLASLAFAGVMMFLLRLHARRQIGFLLQNGPPVAQFQSLCGERPGSSWRHAGSSLFPYGCGSRSVSRDGDDRNLDSEEGPLQLPVTGNLLRGGSRWNRHDPFPPADTVPSASPAPTEERLGTFTPSSKPGSSPPTASPSLW
jgi:hypothetical protein